MYIFTQYIFTRAPPYIHLQHFVHLHTVHFYTCISIDISPVLCMYIFTQYIFTHAPPYIYLQHILYLHTVHFYTCTFVHTSPALCTSSHSACLHMHLRTYISSTYIYIFTQYIFSGHNTVQAQLNVPFKRGESATCITSTSTPPPVHPHIVHLYTCTSIHTSPAHYMYVFTQCFFTHAPPYIHPLCTHAPSYMHLHMYTCTSIHVSPALCTSSNSASVHMHLQHFVCTSSHGAFLHMHLHTCSSVGRRERERDFKIA